MAENVWFGEEWNTISGSAGDAKLIQVEDIDEAVDTATLYLETGESEDITSMAINGIPVKTVLNGEGETVLDLEDRLRIFNRPTLVTDWNLNPIKMYNPVSLSSGNPHIVKFKGYYYTIGLGGSASPLLQRTRDFATWTPVFLEADTATSVSTDGDYLYVARNGTNAGIDKSSDGSTFTKMHFGTIAGANGTAYKVFASFGKVFVLTSPYRSLISTSDSGATWDVIFDNSGPINYLTKDLYGFLIHEDDLYVYGVGTLVRSNDGGDTWTIYDLKSDMIKRENNTILFTGGKIVVSMNPLCYIDPATNEVYARGYPNSSRFIKVGSKTYRCSFNDSSSVIAYSELNQIQFNEKVYSYRDNYSKSTHFYPQGDSIGSTIIIPRDTRAVYRSTDMINWTRINVPTSSTSLVINDGSKWICGGTISFGYSLDDGLTWTLGTMSGSPTNWAAAIATDRSSGVTIAVHENGISRTTDGINWTFTTIANLSNCRNIAVGGGVWVLAGQSRMIYSTDDGLTWTAVLTTSNARGTLSYVGNGFIYLDPTVGTYWSDLGTSWSRINTQTFSISTANGYDIVRMPSGALFHSWGLKSLDNGVTWVSEHIQYYYGANLAIQGDDDTFTFINYIGTTSEPIDILKMTDPASTPIKVGTIPFPSSNLYSGSVMLSVEG